MAFGILSKVQTIGVNQKIIWVIMDTTGRVSLKKTYNVAVIYEIPMASISI